MSHLDYEAPWGRVRIEIADRFQSRLRGLLGRGRLNAGEGLLILPCNSIHTIGMRFPIDVLALDRRGRVRKHFQAVPPGRVIWPQRSVTMMLELAVGSCGAGTLAGQELPGLAAMLELWREGF